MNIGMWVAIAVAVFVALYFGNKMANKKDK
jgi:hypothetical protein